jgi:hypothetical protein
MTAIRAVDGEYVAKQITIALPPEARARSSGVARFAYRGWATGVQEPVRFAVCNIPDTPASRERFAQLFDASVVSIAQLQAKARAAGMSGAEDWAPGLPSASAPETLPTYLVDGLVRDPRVNKLAASGGVATPSTTCGLTAFQCDDGSPNECIDDPSLPGCQPADDGGGSGSGSDGSAVTTDPFCDPYAPVEDPGCSGVPQDPSDSLVPPPADLEPGTVLDPSGDGASLSQGASLPWMCTIWAWSPTHDYYDNVRAKHNVSCSGGVIQFRLSGNIQKQKSYFFGLITWWSTVGVSATPIHDGIGSAVTYTSSSCIWGGRGWWRSKSTLTVTTINEFRIASATSPSRYFVCYI